MEQDKVRAEFEDWISRKHPGIHWITDRDEKDQAAYRNQGVQAHWDAWQASREAVVVEWPDRFDYTDPDCAGAVLLDCRTAISDAGIRTK